MLGVFSAMEVAASGLSAQRIRMNTIASNLANARTTRTAEGGPYRRIDPMFEARRVAESGFGGRFADAVATVKVREVVADDRPGQLVLEPGHPDADAAGYVEYPNVNVVEEMVNMITASRAYEAGVTSIESIKGMARSAIDLGK
ncbi:MAG: flagellar basal body rod protein FlgC [Myxococcales bacterium]|nr:flagellar basal body rod protein FlgC [Myxococcales bacterium]